MISIINIVVFGLLQGASALPTPRKIPNFPTNVGCGEVNVFYMGLPAYHPYVIAQGLDPFTLDISLRNDTANLVKAGYNVRIFTQGPEEPVSRVAERMKGMRWDVTAEGFGVRGFANGTATRIFEDNLFQFQKSAPLAPTVFNWGPNSIEASVARRVPLNEDCTDKPGKLIAYEEFCDPKVCEKVIVITDGGLDELLEGV